ncbi:MAG TPA: hypothetical protein VKU89_01650 [Solirubrobacteraceae bacterium]|nr:hypothetical protein [Solirubrobacteraceae bacterium]
MSDSAADNADREHAKHPAPGLLTFFFAMGAGVVLAAGLVWASAVLGDWALAISLAVAYGVAIFLIREIFLMLSEQE